MDSWYFITQPSVYEITRLQSTVSKEKLDKVLSTLPKISAYYVPEQGYLHSRNLPLFRRKSRANKSNPIRSQLPIKFKMEMQSQ